GGDDLHHDPVLDRPGGAGRRRSPAAPPDGGAAAERGDRLLPRLPARGPQGRAPGGRPGGGLGARGRARCLLPQADHARRPPARGRRGRRGRLGDPGRHPAGHPRPGGARRPRPSRPTPPAPQPGPPVVAVAGWGTQVVIQRATPVPAAPAGPGQAVPSPLDDAAVFMRGTHKPRRPKRDAVIEAARIALAQGRNLFGEGRGADLQDLLLRRCDDPIGGIIGCHLLLVAMDANGVVDPARAELFDTPVRTLRHLVGPAPPGGGAVALGATDPELVPAGPFTAPPMFARGWQLMTDASYDRPDLIPAELWARVHASIALGGSLVWSVDKQSRALHAEQLAQWVKRYSAEPRSRGPEPMPEAARAAARQAHIPAAAAAGLLGD